MAADSPVADSSSPTAASDDLAATDNNLQPFFILHKATTSRRAPAPAAPTKTRRKIDLPSPPPKDAVNPSATAATALYERLRLEALDITWSRIETAIKEALHQINLNLFDELLVWVRDSFTGINFASRSISSEILRPYPPVTDDLCKQLPTAFVLTKNVEFVDDLLTFQELGVHMRSNGCFVANLSPLDFSTKHGVGGCLRGLLRQLVTDAPDMADIAVLALWYWDSENFGKPIVVIVDDMERCDGAVLAEFIRMLSEWVSKIPIIFIMGVATTVDAPRRLLPSDALQHLQACKFMLGSPYERMNAIVEAVLVKPCSGFNIGQKVASFLRSYFLRHDGTITAFIRALKLACTKHFIEEPLSFLGLGILDEEYEAFWCGKCEVLPDKLRRYAFELPSYERGEKICEGDGVSIAQGLSELRRLQKVWSSVVMCLFEVGKLNKMHLLDIYCETTDPASYSRCASDNNLLVHSSSFEKQIEGNFGYVKGGFIAQAIHKIRELPLASVIHLLNIWSIHTKETIEIHEKVRELQSAIGSSDENKPLPEMSKDILKKPASLSVEKGTSVNDGAAMLLDCMVRNFLVPIECMAFHEIVCFKHVDILRLALIGDPRRTIQIDLLKSHTHLQCSCCGGGENVLSPSMHDTSVMYILAQEYGDLINLHDWYQSFKSTISCGTKAKRKIQHSPASKKVNSSPSEAEATIQARFCRAVMELQITGLLRMPSKRRPDFVQRVAFGL